MEAPKALLSSLFQRLSLKEQPFQCSAAATETAMDNLWENVKAVKPSMLRTDRQRAVLQHRPDFQRFVQHCCQIRQYSFSIKKCGLTTCSMCKPPHLPAEVFQDLHFLPDPVPESNNDHYKPFDELYGTTTSEVYCPSKHNRGSSSCDIPFSPSGQTACNVMELLVCSDCRRPRVLYAVMLSCDAWCSSSFFSMSIALNGHCFVLSFGVRIRDVVELLALL